MLILTSDGIDSKEIEEQFKKIINTKTRIAIITTAKNEKEKSNGAQKIYKQFYEMNPKKIDFIDIEIQDVDLLMKYDLIHLVGGNPFRLMYWLNKTKSKHTFSELVKNNKTISGTSAGSMVLGKYIGICDYLSPEMNDVKLKDLSGLELTEINICPHYNNFPSMYQDCDSKVKRCETENNIVITKLCDGQALIIDNNKIKLLKGKVIKEK